MVRFRLNVLQVTQIKAFQHTIQNTQTLTLMSGHVALFMVIRFSKTMKYIGLKQSSSRLPKGT